MTAAIDWNWPLPAHATRITVIDMHTGGEPLRVITGGLPPIAGGSVLEKRRYFREHLDQLRTGLMWEPRGHADMYGAVITRSRDADFDVFFLHNEGYSTMCGHATIAMGRYAVDHGLVPRVEPVTVVGRMTSLVAVSTERRLASGPVAPPAERLRASPGRA